MKRADTAELLLLAALWGGSFLFMRVGAPEFGAVPLTGLRVAGAALVLLPLVALRGGTAELRRAWRPIGVVGLLNSALPFLCFGYASLHLTAGLLGIFNAAAPLFAALIAWWWMGERPGAGKSVGLAVGFAGVAGLALEKAGLREGAGLGAAALAVLACIVATACYGYAANYTRRRLAGVAPLAVAAGSQFAAALALAVPALLLWPARSPSAAAWVSVALLAVACTALAYILYFRLIARLGATRAVSVTFLIPAFAMLWGALLLAEPVTPAMLAGAAVILLGTALVTGLLPWRSSVRA